MILRLFFFNDTATTEIYTLSLHDALPISTRRTKAAATDRSAEGAGRLAGDRRCGTTAVTGSCPAIPVSLLGRHQRSEEHTSELQSRQYLVCRLLLEKKKKKYNDHPLPYAR